VLGVGCRIGRDVTGMIRRDGFQAFDELRWPADADDPLMRAGMLKRDVDSLARQRRKDSCWPFIINFGIGWCLDLFYKDVLILVLAV
jgi:hypothetical protein